MLPVPFQHNDIVSWETYILQVILQKRKKEDGKTKRKNCDFSVSYLATINILEIWGQIHRRS